MQKKTYYIEVENGLILENQGDTPYELEIEATTDEIRELENLFEKRTDQDFELYVDSHIPNKWDEVESDVQTYNEYLHSIYSIIYKLGVPSTREHIEKNNILTKLRTDRQSYDFC